MLDENGTLCLIDLLQSHWYVVSAVTCHWSSPSWTLVGLSPISINGSEPIQVAMAAQGNRDTISRHAKFSLQTDSDDEARGTPPALALSQGWEDLCQFRLIPYKCSFVKTVLNAENS